MKKDLAVMRRIDEIYLDHPTFGSRRISVKLKDYGFNVCRSRVQRLMRLMGIRAIYAKPKTSQPHPDNIVYPYRLKDKTIEKYDGLRFLDQSVRWT